MNATRIAVDDPQSATKYELLQYHFSLVKWLLQDSRCFISPRKSDHMQKRFVAFREIDKLEIIVTEIVFDENKYQLLGKMIAETSECVLTMMIPQ